ncbi:hypothetical protein ACHAWX_000010 [Stephanocyclus meneghinianus]
MIGRADIEESKSNVAMNTWLPQASYPCGSIGNGFPVCIRKEIKIKSAFDLLFYMRFLFSLS